METLADLSVLFSKMNINMEITDHVEAYGRQGDWIIGLRSMARRTPSSINGRAMAGENQRNALRIL
jgi:hypothetical protein